jgi:hypothetical protein
VFTCSASASAVAPLSPIPLLSRSIYITDVFTSSQQAPLHPRHRFHCPLERWSPPPCSLSARQQAPTHPRRHVEIDRRHRRVHF